MVTGELGGRPELDGLRLRAWAHMLGFRGLDALYGTTRPARVSSLVRLPRRPGRDPSVAPGGPGNDKSAADDAATTL
jgi:hypothetical protein